MLERKSIIYDTKRRFIDIQSLVRSGPGWNSISEWHDDPETGWLACYVGWTSINDAHY